ncbi:hypothetical protein BZG36_01176 [Bifiguratus adelaidae]|uniref:DUF4112 domain-containing protein n=1 Tax=Bifiguratus adelaidae TaxID=1938954 RepID=A0A261Y5R4_9FUNG|nr:hypothetical protein BZG36_01176 [Bifiguratus adelaidae]
MSFTSTSAPPPFPFPNHPLLRFRIRNPLVTIKSPSEAQSRLQTIHSLAQWLDQIPGSPIPIGIDSIVGLVPWFGDLAGLALSCYMLYLCLAFGLPVWLLVRMLINVVLDAVIGLVPWIGDVADALFTANLWNYQLLEGYLRQEGVIAGGSPRRSWWR